MNSRWGRAAIRTAFRLVVRPVTVDGVEVEVVEGDGARLRVYRPHGASAGALLWIHGGGFLIGGAKMDDRICGETAREVGITVVSPEYRLAPEHPFPAALDDCYAAWLWMRSHAELLGCDSAQIAVGGQSAGGGLAATLAHRLYDNGVDVCAQWLFSPMLDDRTAMRRELDDIDHLVWNNVSNRAGWTGYLRAGVGADVVPEYSSAARRQDLAGLPPAWLSTSDVDLFHDECVAYAQRLGDAGVDVVLDIVDGGPHGFESWGGRHRIGPCTPSPCAVLASRPTRRPLLGGGYPYSAGDKWSASLIQPG